jgi:uncharacterized ion transporter superfamily protein YfcC
MLHHFKVKNDPKLDHGNSMKKLFSPILNYFESGSEPYAYKPSHRIIFFVVGSLFLLLSLGMAGLGIGFSQAGAILPFIVFFGVALVCLVVSALGSDRAVAKIWGNRK